MDDPKHTDGKDTTAVPLAILLEGVPEKWGMNVLQILGRQTSVQVQLDGYGTIEAPGILLSIRQARRLAAQIVELIGSER
jgi:hypothetical protein